MKALIFNSGVGNRMGDFTRDNHKSMAVLANGETIFGRQLRLLAAAGITDNIVIPWLLDGLGFDAPLERKQDSLKRFADTYIHSGWQD